MVLRVVSGLQFAATADYFPETIIGVYLVGVFWHLIQAAMLF